MRKKLIALVMACVMMVGAMAEPQSTRVFADGTNAAIPDNGEFEPVTDFTIKTFRATLEDGASLNAAGDYVWTATASDSDVGHTLVYRVKFTLSGTNYFEPVKIEIRIPKSILIDREGNPTDVYDISVPEDNTEGLGSGTYFTYHEEGDELVVTNRLTVPAGWNGYLDIAYQTTKDMTAYADYNSSVGTRDRGASEPFSASMKATQGTVVKTASSEVAPVYVNTSVELSSVALENVGRMKQYAFWNSSWGEKPADADDYYYLVWNVWSYLKGNPTQPYHFRLEDTFTAEGGEVVGYRMGCVGVFSDEQEVTVLRGGSYSRCDQVLTRYSKAYYDELKASADESTLVYYSVHNAVQAIVTPLDLADPVSRKTTAADWSFERLIFERPVGNLYSEKYGYDYKNSVVYDSDDIRSYALDRFILGSEAGGIDELTELRFRSVAYGYSYPWSLENGANPDDPKSYGKVPIDVVLTDNELRLSGVGKTGEQLDAEDYEIARLELSTLFRGAVYSEESAHFVSSGQRTGNPVTVWVQKEGGEEWLAAAVYDPGRNLFTDTDGTIVAAADGGTLSFSSGVTGFRLEFSSADYYFSVRADAYVTLKRSEKVLRIASENKKISLSNTQSADFYSKNGDASTPFAGGSAILQMRPTARDYLIGIEKQSNINKTVKKYSNDKINRQLLAEWSVVFSESYRNEKAELCYVEQAGGVFYDLLPAGASVQKNSVKVFADEEMLNTGSYSVSITENFHGSGRVLLTVRIDVPADRYSFRYTSSSPWDALKDFGKQILNSAAYESRNDSIGGGFPDNAQPLTGKEKNLMTDLDPDTDAKRFVYANADFNPVVITAGNLGLLKQVRSANSESYGSSAVVYTGELYSYQIRFATDDSEEAKDLILYDSLESFSAPGLVSNWQGSYSDIDLSVFKELGIDPVLYYAKTAVNIEEQADLSLPVWIRADEFDGDLSEVRAIAVDLRKDSAGKDYTLPKNTAVSCRIYMRAPRHVFSVSGEEPVTYNNVWLQNTLINAVGDVQETELVHQDYTQVICHVVGDVKLEKQASEDPALKLAGMTFALRGTSFYGTPVERIGKTNADGLLCFEEVERGTYQLTETASTDDYQLNKAVWEVTIDGEGYTFVNGVRQDGYYVISNEPRIHGDLKIRKLGRIDFMNGGKELPGVVFRLEGTSDYGNDIMMVGETDAEGRMTLENLELGRYTLTEIQTADGYQLPAESWTVVCNEDGLVYVKDADFLGEYCTLYNTPYHTLHIKKLDAERYTRSLEGAEFSLKGTSNRGTAVNMTAVSDQYGTATFEMLEEGSYVLQETKAPEHYQLDSGKYVITVLPDGSVTGLKPYSDYVKSAQGLYSYYGFPNERAYEGTVTITKKWEDENPDDRPIPVVILSNEEQIDLDSTATINAKSMQSFTRYKTTSLKSFEKDVRANGKTRVDDYTTNCKVYMYSSGSRVYWWSDAEIVYLPEDCTELFYCDWNIEKIDLSGLNTSKVKIMRSMFYNCNTLTELDVSMFDTSNVTDMSYMFYSCYNLLSLNVSNFDTSKVTNMRNMFADLYHIKELNISGLDTSNVTDMSYLFADANQALTSLDVSGFDTSKVTNMNHMFASLDKVESLDVSGFDTSNVTDMSYMFQYCRVIPELDVSGFDTSNVTNMERMFSGIHKVTELDLSHFNTSKVTSMSEMFFQDSSMKKLDLSSFDTSNVTNMAGMFEQCLNLEEVDLSGFDTSKVTTMRYMFDRCEKLPQLDLGSFDTSAVTNMNQMFTACYKLEALDLSHFDTSNVTDMGSMFSNCTALESLNLLGFDTAKANIRAMFNKCSSLTELDLSSFTLKEKSDTAYMFSTCGKLGTIWVGDGWDAEKITSSAKMFENAVSLKGQNGTAYSAANMTGTYAVVDTAKTPGYLSYKKYTPPDEPGEPGDPEPVVKLDYTLLQPGPVITEIMNGYSPMASSFTRSESNRAEANGGCLISTPDSKEEVWLWHENGAVFWYSASPVVYLNPDSSRLFENVEDIDIDYETYELIFTQQKNLEHISLSGLDSSKVTNMSNMFYGSSHLLELDVSGLSTANVTNMSGMFSGCSLLTALDVSGFKTASVTDMSSMFNGCSSVTELDVRGFDTSNVTNMAALFNNCRSVTELDVSGFKTGKVTDMGSLFGQCESLKELDLSSFDTSNVTNMRQIFYHCLALTELDVSSFDTSKVTSMSHMFYGIPVTELDVSSLDTSSVTDMSSMFNSLSLESLDVSNFDTSSVTVMDYMFNNCANLKELDLSSFSANKSSIRSMFQNCSALKTIYVSDRWKKSGTNDSDTFKGCTSLVGGNGTKFSTSRITGQYAVIDRTGTPGYMTYRSSEIRQTTNSVMYEGDPAAADQVYGMWIDNGDGTWTYRFRVFDEDQTYFAWEEDAPGYQWDEDMYHPVRVDYTEGCKNAGAAVTNRKDQKMALEAGSLLITKTVEGDEATEEDFNRAYEFTVTIEGLTDGTYGSMEFKNGVAHVTVQSGRSVSASGIPIGMRYTVTETVPDGFTVTSSGESGIIGAGTLSRVSFTNTKDATTGSLRLTKVLESGDPDEYFTFSVKLSGMKIAGTQIFGSSVFTDGAATVSLKGGETMLFDGIPAGTDYCITEHFHAGYEQLSSKNTEGTIAVQETAEAVFTNKETPVPEGGFTLTKTVVGQETDQSFRFLVVMDHLNPGKTYTLSNGMSFEASAAGSASVSLNLKHGEAVTFLRLPVGSSYFITEEASDYRAAYTITDGAALGKIVCGSAENMKKNTALSTKNEVVDEGESITVCFSNSPVLFPVSFGKIEADGEFLEGAVLQILGESGTMLYEWTSSEVDMESLDLAEGSYVFHEAKAPAGFLPAEDIAFTIDEEGMVTVNGEETGYILMLDKPNQVTIAKLDEEGNPLAGASLALFRAADVTGGEPAENALPVYSFVSGRTAEQLTGVLEAGADYVLIELAAPSGYRIAEPIAFTAPDNETPLELKMTDVQSGSDVPISKYDGDGKRLSGAVLQILTSETKALVREWTSGDAAEIAVLEPGSYILHEKAVPSEKLYVPAEDILFTVQADGTILINGEKADEVAMTDPYTDLKAVSLPLRGKKTMDGAVPKDGAFTFLLKDESGKLLQEVRNEGGTFCFENLVFEAPGTYRFTVSEKIGDDRSIVYDGSEYSLSVTVSSAVDKAAETVTLSVESTLTKNGAPANEILFANVTAEEEPTEPTEPATEPTEPATEPTQPATEPSEPATEPTQPATEPSEPATAPPQPATEPTEPTEETSTEEQRDEPDTSDSHSLWLWICVGAAALVSGVVLLVGEEKRRIVPKGRT